MKKYLSVIMAIVVIFTSTFISIGAVDAGYSDGAGNYVVLRTEDNYFVSYLHMDTIDVLPYSSYSTRTKIGTVGNSGTVAEHLHINVSSTHTIAKDSRTYLDPLAFLPFS